ncbi:helix-turn-helix transcriptional regulator [Halomarina litorea]|uniref:helix-turn-helix transcriptional regulator n=1 Tax=Halomarina litorea TaxID=2961595 RepID=UPI0020C2616B|nr:hypothetical protein [Halomarina sp. BCD28]
MEHREPGDALDLLGQRAPMLRALDEGPTTKAAVQSALGVSRSTVDRGLRDLEHMEFVERTPEGYRVTLCGRVALEAYDRFETQLSGVCEVSDLLSSFPGDVPLDPAVFSGADVIRPDPTAPQRPTEAICDLVRWAEETRGTVVGVSDQFVDVYREGITAGSSVSLVLPPSALRRLLSKYAETMDDVLSTGRVTLRESTATPQFGLKIHRRGDHRVVGLAIYGDDGLRAFVRNDDPEAVLWVESLFESVWADADPIPLP